MIFEKNKLNPKRLGRQKVLSILKDGLVENIQLTKEFQSLNIDWIGTPTLYNYNGNVLYEHGCDLINGKADIYTYDEINRLLSGYKSIKIREKKLQELNKSGRWDVLSKHGPEMINHIPKLLHELSNYLNVSPEKLDFTYKSLDLVSSRINELDLFEEVVNNYDQIYIYIGEVFKKRSNGVWRLSKYDEIPYIDISVSSVQYIPLNVMGEVIWTKGKLNLRKLVVAEYKRFSNRLKCININKK